MIITMKSKYRPTGSFAFQAHGREVEPQQPAVPPYAFRFFFAAGKSVGVELRTHISRRLIRKRILLKQRCNRWFILQQLLEKPRKPREALWVVERREPHLPVKARLVRDVPGWPAR